MGRSESAPYGYCQCGCGEKTSIANRNRREWGHVKGEPVRFVPGHHGRGPRNPNWVGGRLKTTAGYILVLNSHHPRSTKNGYVLEHLIVASRALGRPVPEGSPVHHVNGDGTDNRPCNLVVCEDNAYHALLHVRQDALENSGDPNLRKCYFCGEYGDPLGPDMYDPTNKKNGGTHHYACRSRHERAHEARAGAKGADQ